MSTLTISIEHDIVLPVVKDSEGELEIISDGFVRCKQNDFLIIDGNRIYAQDCINKENYRLTTLNKHVVEMNPSMFKIWGSLWD